MLPGFRSVPLNDAAALREAVGESTAAVLIEPIQGEAGIYPVSDEALLAARQACDEVGALLILDEIQTGDRADRARSGPTSRRRCVPTC